MAKEITETGRWEAYSRRSHGDKSCRWFNAIKVLCDRTRLYLGGRNGDKSPYYQTTPHQWGFLVKRDSPIYRTQFNSPAIYRGVSYKGQSALTG